MTIPLVIVPNPVPLRSATPEPDFQEDVEEFLEELPPFAEDVNATATAMNSAAVEMDEVLATAQGYYNAIVAGGYTDLQGSSTTSTTISTGTKAFATNAGKLWRPAMWVMIRSAANAANWMSGPITAYDVSDGNPLTVDVRRTGGAGTFTDWDIYPTLPEADSSALALLQSVTLAAPAAAFDIVAPFSNEFDEYEIHVRALPTNLSSNRLQFTLSDDAGVTFKSSGMMPAVALVSGGASTSSISYDGGPSSSHFPLIDSSAAGECCGVIRIWRGNATLRDRFQWDFVSQTTSGYTRRSMGGGFNNNFLGGLSGVRISVGTDNFDAGTSYRVFGVKK